jgi:TetR/AcrR family transcriptional regulator, cholesterol catabolism regulator
MTTTAAEAAPGSGGGTASRKRREEIFDAAARIFHEKGYEATSIQDVADAVGILKGSLYYYITSKEDLLFQVIDEVHRESLEKLDALKQVEGDSLVRLRRFIESHVENNARNLVRIGVFFHDFRSLSPERRAQIVAERDLYDKALRSLIREGQVEGVVAEDVDPKLTAMAILGMMNWIYQWYRPDGSHSPERIAREFANLVLAGVVTGAAGRDRSLIGAGEPDGDLRSTRKLPAKKAATKATKAARKR